MNFTQKIESKKLNKAFDLMSKKKLVEAEKVLEEGLKEARGDTLLEGLFFSAHGVLWKLRKDFRKAFKFYDRAEKLIPNDPALKLISARLLIDYFGQYDTVLRKMDRVIDLVGPNFPFAHQALILKGVAWLKKGDKKKAAECLKEAMGQDFEGLQTASNLDFKLVEEMMKKKIEPKLCRDFLEAALHFTKKTGEKRFEKLVQRMLELFPSPDNQA